ncbi:MAG: hypothetical protein QXG00_08305, partial [Candidatus Woesearchaeota archaeon]
LLGIKDGRAIYVSETTIAQLGKNKVMESLGLIKRYPVQIDLSGNIVMVKGDSHEDAISRYFKSLT